MLSQIHILTYIDVENDGKDPKPKDGYHVRISKFRTIFAKDYALNWSRHCDINDINGKGTLLECFMKKYKTQIKQSFGLKK